MKNSGSGNKGLGCMARAGFLPFLIHLLAVGCCCWMPSECQRSASLCLSSAGTTRTCCSDHLFLCGCWGSNSVPHACIASTLPTERRSQPFHSNAFKNSISDAMRHRFGGFFVKEREGTAGQTFNFSSNFPLKIRIMVNTSDFNSVSKAHRLFPHH